ncbi:MAG: acyl-CoA synthetase [Betaproteobacteria bacterium RIFCSPLOWO2_02_FULL_67_26]|nr:MAG: acyl-CoA synthetase [Betaproteobacteria bacterium RIFCSPLOWO2_02_FULL_67_26]
MSRLAELARLIRSKNAGPFELTFDVMFDDAATYERVKASGALTREVIAQRYRLPPGDVKFFFCDNALAIKASIPRPFAQGDLLDADGHGGQQYAPLMDIEIP